MRDQVKTKQPPFFDKGNIFEYTLEGFIFWVMLLMGFGDILQSATDLFGDSGANNIDTPADLSEQEIAAENFLDSFTQDHGNFLIKTVFRDQLKEYLTTEEGMNIDDSLRFLAMDIVGLTEEEKNMLKAAKDQIAKGDSIDYAILNAQYHPQTGLDTPPADTSSTTGSGVSTGHLPSPPIAVTPPLSQQQHSVDIADVPTLRRFKQKAQSILAQYPNSYYKFGGTRLPNVDCSALIYNISKKLGRTSRQQFLSCDKNPSFKPQVITNLNTSQIQPGMLAFWNATVPNPKRRTAGPIPAITASDRSRKYINHVAMIEKVNPNGTIVVIQSSPPKGIQRATIDPNKVKNDRLHNEIYVGDPSHLLA